MGDSQHSRFHCALSLLSNIYHTRLCATVTSTVISFIKSQPQGFTSDLNYLGNEWHVVCSFLNPYKWLPLWLQLTKWTVRGMHWSPFSFAVFSQFYALLQVDHGCFCLLITLVAKSRDAAPDKLDSEVVPKVARMTVSGKKQTMGFDVPRYTKPFSLPNRCTLVKKTTLKKLSSIILFQM